MAIKELRVSGYRSIRQIRLNLRQLNLLTGPSGCGKGNLYRALLLLSKAARGDLARAIAGEGGMPAVLWAGVRKRFGARDELQRVKWAIRTEEFGYELECGLPDSAPSDAGDDRHPLALPASRFLSDPEVKTETARAGSVLVLERNGPMASLRNSGHRMTPYPLALNPSESALSSVEKVHLYPEVSSLKAEIHGWRFHPQFEIGAGSAPRRPQTAVLTPVLSRDASDLAAALETIVEIGDAELLREAVDRAFPGARLEVAAEHQRFRVLMHMPGVLRPLDACELSGGALRYLCLVAALLTPQPPGLLAMREPETGIHPDLIPAVAHLIASASKQTQVWITSNSEALAAQVLEETGEPPIKLRLVDGETRLA